MFTGIQARRLPAEAVASLLTLNEIAERSKYMQGLKENLLRLIKAEKDNLLPSQAEEQEGFKGHSAESAPAQDKVVTG